MKQLAVVLMAMTLSVALAACGGNGGTSGESGNEKASDNASELNIEAVNWEFDKEEYQVPAGEVTVSLKNKEGHHGIAIEGTDLEIEGDGSETVDLKPGTYTIRCIIPCGDGHEDMTSKLIVS